MAVDGHRVRVATGDVSSAESVASVAMVRGRELDVTVRSCRLHAERWGSESGAPVIGLPGLLGNLKNLAFLGERIGGDALQLVALDLRGRGRSETTPRGTYGWDNHALDVLGVADALGFERFAVVGLSMGGSVAMRLAAVARARLEAVVLVDVAGRVDRGVGPLIERSVDRLGRVYASVDHYLEAVRTQGLVDPGSDHWARAHRYELRRVEGGVRPRASVDAVREDRAYTATQDPHERWAHLTMPVLLLRATRELRAGAGLVVPDGERDRFARAVPHAVITEVDADHLTITTHPDSADAVRRFLTQTATR